MILDDVALVSRLIMERPGQKVLYEIRHHASFPYDPRNPPLPQVHDSSFYRVYYICYSVFISYIVLPFAVKFREMELIPKEGFGPVVSISYIFLIKYFHM